MSVYTKTGDKGTTALIGGERVSKFDSRVEAYGAVDELSAFVALLGDKIKGDSVLEDIYSDTLKINSMLMSVESHLAMSEKAGFKLLSLKVSEISYLENRIDEMQAEVPPIKSFTIPGGSEAISLSHVCRTVCRRAERRSLSAAAEHKINPDAIVYLNRLSDYFYLVGRAITSRKGVEEILWIP